MKRALIVLFSLVILAGIFLGCGRGNENEKIVNNVEKIFMHGPNHFSVLVSQDYGFRLVEISTVRYGSIKRGKMGISVIEDVPEGNKMWVKIIDLYQPVIGVVRVDIELHVRSKNDIEIATCADFI